MNAKTVGRAVRAALRDHPELQSATLKDMRQHLEAKMGADLFGWKAEIKASTAQYMTAKQAS